MGGIVKMKLNLCVLALAGVASATSVPAANSSAIAAAASPVAAVGAAAAAATTGAAAATTGAAAMANPDTAPANDAPSVNGTEATNMTVAEPANAANDDKTTTKKVDPTPDPEKAGTAVATMSLGTLLAVYFAL